ncbi:MAG: MerR family transcriptional regulator [Gammaproteobacteria bacterium]
MDIIAESSRTGLKIGQLAQATKCNIETIRYYERAGLLPLPPRTQGGYRVYELEHVKRLNFVRRARDLGFSLEEVRALLRLVDRRGPSCNEARALASQHLSGVQAKITDLKSMERVLKTMVALCKDGNLPDCPLIEALFRESGSR